MKVVKRILFISIAIIVGIIATGKSDIVEKVFFIPFNIAAKIINPDKLFEW